MKKIKRKIKNKRAEKMKKININNYKDLMRSVHTNPDYVDGILGAMQKEFKSKWTSMSYIEEKIVSLCNVMRDWEIAKARQGYEANTGKWVKVIDIIKER